MEITWYEKIGEKKIKELVQYFYAEVEHDDILRPMYPDDLDGAEERLFLFLIQYLGGPTTYSEKRGHPRLRMRHLEFKVDGKSISRWLGLMNKAMGKVNFEEDEQAFLRAYFSKTAMFMKNT